MQHATVLEADFVQSLEEFVGSSVLVAASPETD